ncbi:12235_t:CDS:2, partial [Ambispora leptoticha]
MVKLEEIHDEDALHDDEEEISDNDSTYSTDSAASNDYEESIIERIWALRDIIPQETRESISTNVSRVWNFGWRGANFVGNTLWVLTTTALLLVMPLALEIEREAAIVQMENEQKAL